MPTMAPAQSSGCLDLGCWRFGYTYSFTLIPMNFVVRPQQMKKLKNRLLESRNRI